MPSKLVFFASLVRFEPTRAGRISAADRGKLAVHICAQHFGGLASVGRHQFGDIAQHIVDEVKKQLHRSGECGKFQAVQNEVKGAKRPKL